MNLVSVHSMQEIDYIKFLYKKSPASSILIRATAFLPDTFNWADGSRWNFSYMNPLSTTNGDCLQMNLTTGFWSEVDCGAAEYFVCKRLVVDTSSNLTDPPSPATSPAPVFENLINGPDFSHCNTTLFMGPGVITSFGFPSSSVPKTTCSYNLITTGAYNLGLFFTDVNTYFGVNVYDENGNLLATPINRQTTMIAPSNIATIIYRSSGLLVIPLSVQPFF